MRKWKLWDAVRAVEALNLIGHNVEIANHWLSLWRCGRPPKRASFQPKQVAPHLPAVAIIAVHENESVRCKLAGNYLRLATGVELTGKDMLHFTPEEQHQERIRNSTLIVQGHVWSAHRPMRREDDKLHMIQEVCLPFADPSEDGTRHYLFHSNWRPEGVENLVTPTPRASAAIAPKKRLVVIENMAS